MTNDYTYKKYLLSDAIGTLKKLSNILLIGNYGNGNLGDEILLQSVLDDLKSTGFSVSIAVRDENISTVKNKNVKIISPLTIRGIKAFLSSDVIVIGPGGLFGKDVGPFAMLLPLVTFVSKILNKKVVYYAFGIYEATPKIIQYLVVLACLIADSVTVRDIPSIELLSKNAMLKKKVLLIFDPAFNYEKKLKIKKISRSRHTNIGLSLRYIEDERERKKLLKALSDAFKTLDKVTIIPLNFYKEPQGLNVKRGHPSDSVMIQLLRNMSDVSFSNNADDVDIDKVLDKYKNLDVVIGMRLHAQILALINKIPLFTIGYSPKNELTKNYPEVAYVDYKKLNPQDIRAFVKERAYV